MSLSGRELFGMWVDPASPWSAWAKPTLFAGLMRGSASLPLLPDFTWDDKLGRDWAAVVDLPEDASVLTGLAMAREGFRPVPVFNGCPGQAPLAAIDTLEIQRALEAGAAERVLREIPADAAPAFLVDSRRKSNAVLLRPGMLDNRWVCFAQDFPSAGYMKGRGINNVVVVRPDASMPADDLLHVLRRWEEGGLKIHLQAVESPEAPKLVRMPRPPYFRSLLYPLLVRMGLRPSFAGGFGGVIPQPTQG